MRPREIKLAVKKMFEARIAVMLWGGPGEGKTQTVRAIGAELNRFVRDTIRPAHLDPVDVRGLPMVREITENDMLIALTKWCQPDFLPREGNDIVFLDELNMAPQLVQGSFYQLLEQRRLGDYVAPPGVDFIAAGNRETDRSVVTRMPMALCNRMAHFNYENHIDDWTEWAFEANINSVIIGFLRFRPELLSKFDSEKSERAFPTPRTWEYLSRTMAVGPPKEIEHSLYAGLVGEGTAVEFISYLDMYRELPNLDAILLDPKSVKIDKKKPEVMYAVCYGLAKKATEANFDRIATFCDSLPDEFAVMCVRNCMKQCTDIVSTKAFSRWSAKISDVIS